jgi:hypothetical protein
MATCPKQGIEAAGFTLGQPGARVDAALFFVLLQNLWYSYNSYKRAVQGPARAIG